jgi:hypothetical protein
MRSREPANLFAVLALGVTRLKQISTRDPNSGLNSLALFAAAYALR